MNTYKAYRIKTGAEIVRGDEVRSRKGTAYRFDGVAENGNVLTRDDLGCEFSQHPGDLVGVMVRAAAKPETPAEEVPADLELAIFGDYHSVDNKYLKSYKTRKALAKALWDMGVRRDIGAFAVCNSAGRWTAIIPAHRLGGNMTAFPGFMKLG